MLGGSPSTRSSSADAVGDRIGRRLDQRGDLPAPGPARTCPGIAPLLIPCGALALLLVDVLACWLRRVPLAGLPLLAVYCVPISLLGGGVSWVVFAARRGRLPDDDVPAGGGAHHALGPPARRHGRGGRPAAASASSTGASRTSAGTVGSVAVVLAVILPVFIPTLHLDGLGLFGPGGGGGDGVKVVNPIDRPAPRPQPRHGRAAARRSTPTTPTRRTCGSRCSTSSTASSGAAGDRAIIQRPDAPTACCRSRAGPGRQRADRRSYNYTVTRHRRLRLDAGCRRSSRSPSIDAAGRLALRRHDDGLHRRQRRTDHRRPDLPMTAVKPQLSSYAMANSLTRAARRSRRRTPRCPRTLPPVGRATWPTQVTAGADSRFEQAVVLQDWFRDDGGFRYCLQARAGGNGNDACCTSSAPGKGGRVGYCEQFAAALAVMARTLGIPARVAVGFLEPDAGPAPTTLRLQRPRPARLAGAVLPRLGLGAVRAHARGSRAPGRRRRTPPSVPVRSPARPDDRPTAPVVGSPPTRRAPSSTPAPSDTDQRPPTSRSGAHVPWVADPRRRCWCSAVLGGLALRARRGPASPARTGGSTVAPRTPGPSCATRAVDLGVAWPAGRSPHETGYRLAALVRARAGRRHRRCARRAVAGWRPGPRTPSTGSCSTLERVRYARYADDVPGALAEDVADLHRGARARLHHAARCVGPRGCPRSLFGRGDGPRRGPTSSREPEAVAAGGVVDHVG